MGTHYLPSTLQGLKIWAQTFATLVVDQPATYGVSIADATVLGEKFDAYSAALTVSTTPATRTTPTIQTTRTCRDELISVIRPIVKTIQSFPGTTDTMRAQLGITIPAPGPSPVPKPDTSPVLTVVATMGAKIKLTLRAREEDGQPSVSRARPAGVRGANVYFAAGETYPLDLTTWLFKGTVSQSTFELTVPSSIEPGSKVWITAQWLNTRNETGPASEPISTRVAGGLQQAA